MLISIIVIMLFLLSIIYTIKYKFIQFKAFKIAKKVLLKDKSKTAYQTFVVSLASHIGTGNIVGISTAIIYGGAGSIFWMWVFTIFISIFSLIENTLAQRYKIKINGEYRGGTCYYIKNGLNKPILAFIFALFLVLTNTIFFQPLQVNTISETLYFTFNIDRRIIFIIMVLFAILVIFKGTNKIIKFSEVIVPIMSITYMLVIILVLIINFKYIPNMFVKIVVDAFNCKSITSGFFSSCLLIGFKRSLFSNEAGLGTMPSISAMADIDKPIKQGMISTFGVYFDTLIICSLTGFAILIYNMDLSQYHGSDLILVIFSKIFGKFGIYLSMFFMLTFALATIVSEYYSGESNLLYITSNYKINSHIAYIIFKILYILGLFTGCFLSLEKIWYLVDYGMILLGLVNIYAIIKLRNEFSKELALL